VIITDLFLHYTCWRLLSLLAARNQIFRDIQSPASAVADVFNPVLYLFTVLVLNAGLFMIDHIHFQYNGMLLGLLLLCVELALRRRFVALALAFSSLVCSKHLFVYLAPPFGIFLLRNYCFVETEASVNHKPTITKTRVLVPTPPINITVQSLFRIMQLAVAALVPVTLAFGPFVLQENGFDQVLQIFRRLFPFGRGLVHAYWAPNIWALYCATDKILGLAAKKVFKVVFNNKTVSGLASTSGLTGDFQFLVLPAVPPLLSLLLVLMTQSPAWYRLWIDLHPRALLPCLVYCSLCSYLFGYHVHEKAVLISQVLAGLVALRSEQQFEIFALLSVVGVYSQIPLLFQLYETPTKGCDSIIIIIIAVMTNVVPLLLCSIIIAVAAFF